MHLWLRATDADVFLVAKDLVLAEVQAELAAERPRRVFGFCATITDEDFSHHVLQNTSRTAEARRSRSLIARSHESQPERRARRGAYDAVGFQLTSCLKPSDGFVCLGAEITVDADGDAGRDEGFLKLLHVGTVQMWFL